MGFAQSSERFLNVHGPTELDFKSTNKSSVSRIPVVVSTSPPNHRGNIKPQKSHGKRSSNNFREHICKAHSQTVCWTQEEQIGGWKNK